MNHMWWTVVMKWNDWMIFAMNYTKLEPRGKKIKNLHFFSFITHTCMYPILINPLIKRFRGLKISQWPLRFCQLLDNMSLVTLVKIITFWPYWTFSKSLTFAESDTFKTFWNPWRLPILVITIVNQGVSQNLRIKSCWILNLFSIFLFYSEAQGGSS